MNAELLSQDLGSSDPNTNGGIAGPSQTSASYHENLIYKPSLTLINKGLGTGDEQEVRITYDLSGTSINPQKIIRVFCVSRSGEINGMAEYTGGPFLTSTGNVSFRPELVSGNFSYLHVKDNQQVSASIVVEYENSLGEKKITVSSSSDILTIPNLTPPVLTFQNTEADKSSPIISVSTDINSAVHYQINNGDWVYGQHYQTSHSITLPNIIGIYQLKVKAIEPDGNFSIQTQEINIKYLQPPPVITFNNLIASKSSPIFNVSVNVSSLIHYKIDDEPWVNTLDYAFSKSIRINKKAGSHKLTVKAEKPDGNSSEAIKTVFIEHFGQIDSLSYEYNSDERLIKVSDLSKKTEGFSSSYSGEENHYNYDENGNLTKDLNNDIINITYNHLNLPIEIEKTSGTIFYEYNASGQRISKIVNNVRTEYIRDSGGLIIAELKSGDQKKATFDKVGDPISIEKSSGNEVIQNASAEFSYTSDDLKTGITLQSSNAIITSFQMDGVVGNSKTLSYIQMLDADNATVGKIENVNDENDSNDTYFYYLKDHLGNIRITIKDNAGTAEVVSAQDYYPFGMVMPGRSFQSTTDEQNKFKYQGKERDLETGYDYFEARFYDSAIARFLQVDPHAETYPYINPYQSMNNNPLFWTDPTGKDIIAFEDKEGDSDEQKRLNALAREAYAVWLKTEQGQAFYNAHANDKNVIITMTAYQDQSAYSKYRSGSSKNVSKTSNEAETAKLEIDVKINAEVLNGTMDPRSSEASSGKPDKYISSEVIDHEMRAHSNKKLYDVEEVRHGKYRQEKVTREGTDHLWYNGVSGGETPLKAKPGTPREAYKKAVEKIKKQEKN